jgi:hypothetical protein
LDLYLSFKDNITDIHFGKPHKAPLKAKLAKEYVLHSAHKNKTKTTLPKERQPVTSGLNASRGELHRLNFCAIFEVRFSHQQ